MTHTVLIADKLSSRAVDIFQQKGIKADVKTGLDKDGLLEIIGNYDALLVRSSTKVTPEVLAGTDRLRVVGRAGIGVDNIDIGAASQKGVIVMNTPFGNAVTTAEHTIAMMLTLARQLPLANTSTKAGKWEKSRFMGVEVTGKHLGLIGCGNIGTIVASRAQGLKLKVSVYDPYLSKERAHDIGVNKVTLDELLEISDFISLHVPNTAQTRNILSSEALDKTKAGVRIINCARGGLIDEEALYQGLVSGHIAGAALDVFAVEPATDNPLFTLDNVVCTPHLGASTVEAQEKVALQVAEQVADYLITGAVTNAINAPSITAEEAPRLKPYIKLANVLGSLGGQISRSSTVSVRIIYEGETGTLNIKALTAAVLASVLKPSQPDINMISAPTVARERGIVIEEVVRQGAKDQSQIRLEVTSENYQRSFTGTVYNDHKPRITEIMGVKLDAEPLSNMLYVRNNDAPGFVGRIGTLLGDADVNIATFNLGRQEAGSIAVCLLGLDKAIPDPLFNAIQALPDVQRISRLVF